MTYELKRYGIEQGPWGHVVYVGGKLLADRSNVISAHASAEAARIAKRNYEATDKRRARNKQ